MVTTTAVKRLDKPEKDEGADVSIRMIDFETGHFDLRAEHKDWLATNAIQAVRRGRSCFIHLIGFASKLGSPAANLALSQRRMDEVLKTFRQMGREHFDRNVVRVSKEDALGDTDYTAKSTDNSANERAVEVHIFVNRPPKPKPLPAPPIVTLAQDIWIRFNGTDTVAQEGTRDDGGAESMRRLINSAAYLTTHAPLKAIAFYGAGNEKRPGIEAEVVSEVRKIRSATKPGRICIMGGSVGGPNALRVASLLSSLRSEVGPIAFLGIADGAFFERNNDIEGFNPFFIRTPDLNVDDKRDYYQLFGHNLFRNSDGTFAEGTEFHGPMREFRNFQVDSDEIKDPGTMAVIAEFNKIILPSNRQKIAAADLAHDNAFAFGLHFSNNRIVEILNGKN